MVLSDISDIILKVELFANGLHSGFGGFRGTSASVTEMNHFKQPLPTLQCKGSSSSS